MPKITAKTFRDFPFHEYASHAVIVRGERYFENGHVEDIDYQGSHAHFLIEGSYDNYEVAIYLRSEDQVGYSCTCPHAQQVPMCKHIVASILALNKYLNEGDKESKWEDRLAYALSNISPAPKNTKKYAAFFFLQQGSLYYGQTEFAMNAAIVRKSKSTFLKKALANEAPLNETLSKNFKWIKDAQVPHRSITHEACYNLTPEEVSLFNTILEQQNYYHPLFNFATFLPMMAKNDTPLFYLDEMGKIETRLKIQTEAALIKTAIIQTNEELSIEAGVEIDGKLFTSIKDNILIISEDPPWGKFGNTLAPIQNAEVIEIFSYLPLSIPKAEEEHFRSNYLPLLAEKLPVEGDIIEWEDVREDATPRLYLRKEDDLLVAELRFGYGAHETRAEKKPATVKMTENPGSWTLTRIHRQPERELDFYSQIKGSLFGLKRGAKPLPYGSFVLRANTHPYDFLTKSIPALTDAGFEIYGDKESLGKLNSNSPSISLNITSGIDWFDLDVIVNYGEQQVKLKDVRKALKKGQNYIKLADGSIGQIPEKWLDRYKHLFNMTKETEDGFRVRDYQLAMVDELLEDSKQQEIAAAFYKKRDRLRHLEKIAKIPIPKGFKGELRPYQRAGLNWLHFLREYGFGGILADDMGLGKTIQMLAFLQSLKEMSGGSDQAQVASATLLVVPKSLITNWQREAAVFTPNLRILEHLGIEREKDVSIFDAYEIVITTYGTMLRDVEFLRGYQFENVILDESQAIKNPLAKTSKAARLLNARHRFAMTGTPVENNTFELWSQFAFLNPGLLGNMGYFKSEFATPIESKNDKETADLLRRMVYPFILRRTKKQVTPELPPRTERIIYTDFDSEQRKLYEETRDRYRGQLLGLLDEQGMDQTRMQILEGLLRLRQICIHPRLAEPTYQGKVTKFEMLMDTLEMLKAEGHKALIFSQFVETLKMLEGQMKEQKYKYSYLDGKTRKRQQKVDAFQNDPSISFFLISLKAGGVGLNLTAADYVIHLDPWWNPAVEMQAADRAHRIGQENPVFVYKFIVRDTVEEKIIALQERKKALVDQLISAEQSFFKSLTRDDVDALFS